MGLEVVDTMNRVLISDHANYFIIDPLHTLPHLIDHLPQKQLLVQVSEGPVWRVYCDHVVGFVCNIGFLKFVRITCGVVVVVES